MGRRALATPEARLNAPLLVADGVAYRYPHGGAGLPSVSMEVDAGERLLIAGPSGCGKSTLARILTGLIPHLYRGTLDGTVWVDGLSTRTAQLWQLAERAGLVLQNPAAQMVARTAEEEIVFGLENLGLDPATIGRRLEEALSGFGLETMRARSPSTLSGGEQQKLALAAIMARRPPLLVLDEPLSMLDTTAAAELVAHLVRLADAGTAVVLCEHREEMVRSIPALRTLRLAGPPEGRSGVQASAGRLSSSPPWPDSAPTSRLEVRGLTVRLGGRAVLDDLSFSAEAGQVLAVVARNGVGKTTLLRALAGLQRAEGSASVDGRPPDFGLVFQNADLQLFNATVRDEVLYRVPHPDPVLYGWLLEALGLARYEAVPPLLLSEGEKKRVALATVLMRAPRDGLLLDEPAVGQDAAHKEMLVRLARALARAGKLVIITTHDLALAAQADRLLLLAPEGAVADGPPSQLFAERSAWDRLGLLVPDWMWPAPAEAGGEEGA